MESAASTSTSMKQQPPTESSSSSSEGWSGTRDHGWVNLCFFCFVGVVPGVLCTILVATYFVSIRSPEDETTTGSETFPLHPAPTFDVSRITPPSIVRPPSMPKPAPTRQPHVAVNTTPKEGHVAPNHDAETTECSSLLCTVTAGSLKRKLNSSVEPCKDFYGYVCGSFKGTDQMSHLRDVIISTTVSYAKYTKVPEEGQTSWQKAAALYQACIAFVKSNENKTDELVQWMISLDLDLLNTSMLETVNPVEMIVRCSLDIGVPALFSIMAVPFLFLFDKRAMLLEYSREEEKWIATHSKWSYKENLEEYTRTLYWSKDANYRNQTAAKIIGYEKELENITKRRLVPGRSSIAGAIRSLAEVTSPNITSAQWSMYFSKYSNDTYRGDDWILYEPHIADVLMDLLKSQSVGEEGLRYLVAWSLFTHLVPYTVPSLLLGKRKPATACFEHVRKVAKLALVSPFLQAMVQPDMVASAMTMVNAIRYVFVSSVESSPWITGKARQLAIKRIGSMVRLVGSPGQRLDPFFVEEEYSLLEDMNTTDFFSSSMSARTHSIHSMWRDQKTWLYDETSVHAHYYASFNTIIVPTLLLTSPIYYSGAPLALNYGGLGTIVGREIARIFEADLALSEETNSTEPGFKEGYNKRRQCFSQTGGPAVNGQGSTTAVNTTQFSELLADLVGVSAAYETFLLLPRYLREMTFAGLDVSAKRLFFINYCVRWCGNPSGTTADYSSFRARCMLPLMNLPAFSDVFGCKAGDPMNPTKKCTFWQ